VQAAAVPSQRHVSQLPSQGRSRQLLDALAPRGLVACAGDSGLLIDAMNSGCAAHTVACLVAQGADVTARGCWLPDTPLYAAARACDARPPYGEELVRLLLSAGAIPATDRTRGTLLHHCVRSGHVGLTAILLQHGAGGDMQAADARGDTPLSLAAEHGHEGALRTFATHDARTAVRGVCEWLTARSAVHGRRQSWCSAGAPGDNPQHEGVVSCVLAALADAAWARRRHPVVATAVHAV
jgi:ankyrin repeat protein